MAGSKLSRRKGSLNDAANNSKRNALIVVFIAVLLILSGFVALLITMQRAATKIDRDVQRQIRSVLERPNSTEKEIAVQTIEYNNNIKIEVDGEDEMLDDGGLGILILVIQGIGKIQINLRSDLSPESVDYIRRMVSLKQCPECNFFLAGDPDFGIVEGIMSEGDDRLLQAKAKPQRIREGKCPEHARELPTNCPPDKKKEECGCHGPLMEYGMVAWVVGYPPGKPKFFFNNYKDKVADWWGTQHTVWGQVVGVTSFETLNKISNQPKSTEEHKKSDLASSLRFTMQLID